MKKIITLILALAVLVCLFGCGQEGGKETDKVSDTVSVAPESEGSTTGTEAADEEFLGEYYEDEASGYTLEVTESILNPGTYSFRVYCITEDNKEENVWTFTGKYEGKDTVSYTDGEKTVYKYNDDGSEIDNVEYSDGTGSITKDGDTVIWKDDKEDAGKDLVFKIGVKP